MKTKLATILCLLTLTAVGQLRLINIGTNADIGTATITIPGFMHEQSLFHLQHEHQHRRSDWT